MSFETGCCGYHFKENEPNLVGLITLSMPMIIIGNLLLFILIPLSKIIKPLKKICELIKLIVRINLRLIHMTPIVPKIRCKVAGYLLPHFARISGVAYKNFNFLLLLFLWAVFLLPICLLLS